MKTQHRTYFGTISSKMQANWPKLPSLPLEMIYSFLPRYDQVNMSQVCRSWSEGYGSPSVWKTFKFALRGSLLSMDTCPMVKFVKKYGRMFRYVEIEGVDVSNDLMNTFSSHLIEFLEVLTVNTQLISVEFHYFSACFEKVDNSTYNNIHGAIAVFLSSQNNLRRVKFNRCSFRYQDSVELLRNLFRNNRMSLTHLEFRTFHRDEIGEDESNSNAAQNPPFIADFPNLKTLVTDYSLIFENLVKRQRNAITRVENIKTMAPLKLKLFNSRSFEMDRDVRGLISKDWLFMKTLYSYLEIELVLLILSSARYMLEFIITPNMPISRLYLDSIKGHEISELFRHLLACRTNEYLVSLEIDWEYPEQHLFSTINPFLLACQRLEYFKLTLFPSARGLEALLESWVENRPQNLREVIIDVMLKESEYDLTSMNKCNEYVSVLNFVELNISMYF